MQAGEQVIDGFQIFELEMRARKDDLTVAQRPFSQFKLDVRRMRTYEEDVAAPRPDICSRSAFIEHLNEYKGHPLRKSLWTELYVPFQDEVSKVPGRIEDPRPIVLRHRNRLDRWFQSWCISAAWFMDDIESSIESWLVSALVYGKELDGEDVPPLTCVSEEPVMPKEFTPVFQDPYPVFHDLYTAKQFLALKKIFECIPDPYLRSVGIRGVESSFVTRLESPETFVERMRTQFEDALKKYMAEYETQYVERKFVLRDTDWSVRRIAGQTLREIVDASPIHENSDPEQTVKKATERFAIDKLRLDRRMLTVARKRKVQK